MFGLREVWEPADFRRDAGLSVMDRRSVPAGTVVRQKNRSGLGVGRFQRMMTALTSRTPERRLISSLSASRW